LKSVAKRMFEGSQRMCPEHVKNRDIRKSLLIRSRTVWRKPTITGLAVALLSI
jgi:hypothetical protein